MVALVAGLANLSLHTGEHRCGHAANDVGAAVSGREVARKNNNSAGRKALARRWVTILVKLSKKHLGQSYTHCYIRTSLASDQIVQPELRWSVYNSCTMVVRVLEYHGTTSI
jgi:hypothetical protein